MFTQSSSSNAPDLFSQPILPTGEELKADGIRRAVEHADREIDSWSERAYKFFLKYIERRNTEFRTEDARFYAELHGLEIPPSKRAWGAITLRAARAGLIVKSGHAAVSNPLAHKAFASLWKVVKNG